MDDCQNKNISILCWNDKRYPLRAKKPADAPVVLYYKGNIKEIDQTVGIVGARRCSQEAKKETVSLASEYAQKGIAVVYIFLSVVGCVIGVWFGKKLIMR